MPDISNYAQFKTNVINNTGMLGVNDSKVIASDALKESKTVYVRSGTQKSEMGTWISSKSKSIGTVNTTQDFINAKNNLRAQKFSLGAKNFQRMFTEHLQNKLGMDENRATKLGQDIYGSDSKITVGKTRAVDKAVNTMLALEKSIDSAISINTYGTSKFDQTKLDDFAKQAKALMNDPKVPDAIKEQVETLITNKLSDLSEQLGGLTSTDVKMGKNFLKVWDSIQDALPTVKQNVQEDLSTYQTSRKVNKQPNEMGFMVDMATPQLVALKDLFVTGHPISQGLALANGHSLGLTEPTMLSYRLANLEKTCQRDHSELTEPPGSDEFLATINIIKNDSLNSYGNFPVNIGPSDLRTVMNTLNGLTTAIQNAVSDPTAHSSSLVRMLRTIPNQMDDSANLANNYVATSFSQVFEAKDTLFARQ